MISLILHIFLAIVAAVLALYLIFLYLSNKLFGPKIKLHTYRFNSIIDISTSRKFYSSSEKKVPISVNIQALREIPRCRLEFKESYYAGGTFIVPIKYGKVDNVSTLRDSFYMFPIESNCLNKNKSYINGHEISEEEQISFDLHKGEKKKEYYNMLLLKYSNLGE